MVCDTTRLGSPESFGFNTYQPSYLDLYFKDKNILNGANFASSASGYHNSTAILYGTLTLDQQLEYYKDCQKQLIRIAGRSHALSIIGGAVYLISAGNVDFMMNYYINPCLHKVYTPHQFADILVQNYANFIQSLYALGARRIGVATVTAMGCFPYTILTFGAFNDYECVEEINNVAIYFNQKLNSTSANLRKMLPDLNLVILDSYQPLYNLVTKPSGLGFSVTKMGCYRIYPILSENTNSIFNDNKKIPVSCPNASEYVFWDGFHPTEAANKFLAAELIAQGIYLLS
ncbi:GDSL esterase/lipase [Trifolium repens]|nr:GDSL esterase/lipase [Trifolium repens]